MSKKGYTEEAAKQAYFDTCNAQNWNEDTQILHLEGFIAEKGLWRELAKVAKDAAKEENESAELETEETE